MTRTKQSSRKNVRLHPAAGPNPHKVSKKSKHSKPNRRQKIANDALTEQLDEGLRESGILPSIRSIKERPAEMEVDGEAKGGEKVEEAGEKKATVDAALLDLLGGMSAAEKGKKEKI